MNPIAIYLAQVAEQAAFAVTAYQRAMRALADNPRPHIPSEGDEFWLQIQLFANCSANVSRLLWSQRSRFAAERADLRMAVGVSDSSPIKETLVRNDLEHFDERIRTWSQLPGQKLYGDRLIGTAIDRAYPDSPPPKTDFFRAYDPEMGDLIFWGNRLNVHLVAAELGRVRDRAIREIEAREGLP